MDTMGELELDGDEDILDGDDDDIEGMDDIEGLDVVGAVAKRRVALARALKLRGALGRRMPKRRGLPPALQGVTTQGVSRPKEELDALPFAVTQFAAGVLAAGASSFAEAFPQRPFRGERLIATALRENAGVVTDVSSGIVISPAWYVGAVQVGASQGDLPLATFSPQAFGVRLAIPPAGQGTRIFIPFIMRIPQVAGDTTTVSFALIGRAVR